MGGHTGVPRIWQAFKEVKDKPAWIEDVRAGVKLWLEDEKEDKMLCRRKGNVVKAGDGYSLLLGDFENNQVAVTGLETGRSINDLRQILDELDMLRSKCEHHGRQGGGLSALVRVWVLRRKMKETRFRAQKWVSTIKNFENIEKVGPKKPENDISPINNFKLIDNEQNFMPYKAYNVLGSNLAIYNQKSRR